MPGFEDTETNDMGDLSNHCDAIFENTSSGSGPPATRYFAAPEFNSRSESSDVVNNHHLINGGNSYMPSQDFNCKIFHSTMFLHAYERPGDLPQKDPHEARRHRIECNRIMQVIYKRHHERLTKFIAEQERREEGKMAAANRLKYWCHEVIPRWNSMVDLKTLFDEWWLGIPSSIRSEVWQLIIGNPLGITRDLFESCLAHSHRKIRLMERQRVLAEGLDTAGAGASATLPASAAASVLLGRLHSMPNGEALYGRSRVMRQNSLTNSVLPKGGELTPLQSPASSPTDPPPSLSISEYLSSNEESSLQVIQLDVSRTFPMLGAFQTEGLHTRNLHDLLAAFVAYQPSLGYLQGMSFIAGIFLIVFDDLFTAFVAFAALMNRPSFYAFYSLEESEFAAYFGAFDALLEDRMPRLATHLKTCRLECKLYLFDWLFTVFSRSLPFEVVLRIWDLFLRDGEPVLLLAALGILQMYEERLLFYDFDHLASFLTGPMPESMSPDLLTSCMRSLNLSNSDIKRALSKARESSNNRKLGCTNGASTRLQSTYDPIPTTLELFIDGEELKKSETPFYKWSFLGLRSKRVETSQTNSSGTKESARFSSFRRKSHASNTSNSPTAWSKDVYLDFPKRDMV